VKFYKRQLKSLADLKHEKVLLQYIKGEHDAADLFSTKGLKSDKKDKGLAGDSSGLDGLLSAGMSLLGLGGGGKKSKKGQMPFAEFTDNPALKMAMKMLPKKKIAGFVWEILSGYLKWRAVEGGIWGLKKAVQLVKEKKRLQLETLQMDPAHKRRAVAVKAEKKFLGLF
jgi:hypothetical protein